MIAPWRVGDFLQDALEAFLELSAVGRAGDQRAHVERDHATVAQRLRDVAVDDPLGEALDDRGLAHAGLADQHGVVLGAPAQHLDHAADLVVAADDRVELALLGVGGEVAPEALQRGLLLLGGRLCARGGAVSASSLLLCWGRPERAQEVGYPHQLAAAAVGDGELGAEGAAHLLELFGEAHLRLQGLQLDLLDPRLHRPRFHAPGPARARRPPGSGRARRSSPGCA